MANYQTRFMHVSAIKWERNNLQEVIDFCGAENVLPIERRIDYDLKIKTPAGPEVVQPYDFIIRDTDGFWVMQPDMFDRFYRPFES